MAGGYGPAAVHRIELPLHRPLRSAHGQMATRPVLIVERRVDGVAGWAECGPVPGHSGETVDQAEAALRAWAGGEPARADASPMGWAAWTDADLDARLRSQGVSLARHLGATRARVEAAALVDLTGTPDEAAERARALVARGHRHLRVKIEPGDDIARIRAVIEANPGGTVRADANESYAGREGELAALDGLGLAAIEQPLSRGDLDGHAALRARLDTPVALDESASTPEQIGRILAAGAADLVAIKPSRLGGVEAALISARRCQDAGVDVFAGGMWESAVGRHALAALAATAPFTVAGDMGPPAAYLAADLAPYPSVGNDGCVPVWQGPGSGPEPDLRR